VLVSGYTDKAFADEAVRVLKLWRYTPAYEHGEPIGVRMHLKFYFSATGRVVTLTPLDTMEAVTQSWLPAPSSPAVCTPSELRPSGHTLANDRPGVLGATRRRRRKKPPPLVDFYVDETPDPHAGGAQIDS